MVVVGIGASAGGLEAFQSLLPNLPEKANIAYVIVQHLDPTHPTMLASLLKRCTDLPVTEVSDGQKPEADAIYITPPGKNVMMENGTLKLSAPITAIGP